jgi:hypothetical protein
MILAKPLAAAYSCCSVSQVSSWNAGTRYRTITSVYCPFMPALSPDVGGRLSIRTVHMAARAADSSIRPFCESTTRPPNSLSSPSTQRSFGPEKNATAPEAAWRTGHPRKHHTTPRKKLSQHFPPPVQTLCSLSLPPSHSPLSQPPTHTTNENNVVRRSPPRRRPRLDFFPSQRRPETAPYLRRCPPGCRATDHQRPPQRACRGVVRGVLCQVRQGLLFFGLWGEFYSEVVVGSDGNISRDIFFSLFRFSRHDFRPTNSYRKEANC